MRVFGSAVALLAAITLCLYPLTLVADIYPFLLLPCVAAAAFLLALITGEWILVGPGAGVLLLAYALALNDSELAFDPFAVMLGVGMMVLIDTLDLVPLLGRKPRPGREVIAGHVLHMVIVSALGAIVSIAIVAAARLVSGGPPVLAAPAALAALGAVAIALVQARRSIERR